MGLNWTIDKHSKIDNQSISKKIVPSVNKEASQKEIKSLKESAKDSVKESVKESTKDLKKSELFLNKGRVI